MGTDNIQRLEKAFPDLVWAQDNDHVCAGSLMPGRGYKANPAGPGWQILVDIGNDGWMLVGPMTDDLTYPANMGELGPDPIAGLRAVLQAEGIRLARESDERADTARMLGGQPQADWRAAAAEDSAAYMARRVETLTAALESIAAEDVDRDWGEDANVALSRATVAAEVALDGRGPDLAGQLAAMTARAEKAEADVAQLRYRDEIMAALTDDEACEYSGREGRACEACGQRIERHRARLTSEAATVRKLLADATTEVSRTSLDGLLQKLESELAT